MGLMSCVMSLMLHVAMLPVTCHRTLMPTATATDPPSPNSPTMPRRLVCKDPKPEIFKKHKNYLNGKGQKPLKVWQY